MNLEDSLNAFTSDDLTHGKRRVDAIASPMSDNNPDEFLNSLLVAFLNSAMNADRVADLERERFFSMTALFYNVKSFLRGAFLFLD